MQRNECKPGTEVIIRGTIKKDDGSGLCPINITIRHDGGKTGNGFCEPSALEPAQPKYDPARKFRKGDLVRITGYHGRLFGCGNVRKLGENNKIGDQVTLCEDERYECDVCIPEGVLSDKYNYLSVACVELVKPIEEIEKEDTQTCTPDEACCCDTAAEQAPVTVEMIEEAYNHLSDMVNRCQTPVLLHILIEKGDRVSGKNATCAAVTEMPGAKGTEWLAARGYLFAAGTCFSGSPEVVSQGVKLAFEKSHRNVGVNPIAAILGIAGCECEECQD